MRYSPARALLGLSLPSPLLIGDARDAEEEGGGWSRNAAVSTAKEITTKSHLPSLCASSHLTLFSFVGVRASRPAT